MSTTFKHGMATNADVLKINKRSSFCTKNPMSVCVCVGGCGIDSCVLGMLQIIVALPPSRMMMKMRIYQHQIYYSSLNKTSLMRTWCIYMRYVSVLHFYHHTYIQRHIPFVCFLIIGKCNLHFYSKLCFKFFVF